MYVGSVLRTQACYMLHCVCITTITTSQSLSRVADVVCVVAHRVMHAHTNAVYA